MEHFEIKEYYASFDPVGQTPLPSLIALLKRVMTNCQENRVSRLQVNLTRLTHHWLTTPDRYFLAEGLARFWDRSIKLSLICRTDQIDPQRFGQLVASNRGLNISIFTSEEDGLAWLLES
jgi:hypothetical protein